MVNFRRLTLLISLCLIALGSLDSQLFAQRRRMTARKRAAQENVLTAAELITNKKYDMAYSLLNDVVEKLDRKNALAYYYLALLYVKSEKYRDKEKVKHFISLAEEYGLDYEDLGLKKIEELSIAESEEIEEGQESLEIPGEKPAQEVAVTPPPDEEKSEVFTDTLTQKDEEISAEEKVPEAAPLEEKPAGEKMIEPEKIEPTLEVKLQKALGKTPVEVDTFKAPELAVETRPKPALPPQPTPAIVQEKLPEKTPPDKPGIFQPAVPAVETVIEETKTVEETKVEYPTDLDRQIMLPTQLIRWGMNLPMENFLYDVESEMGLIKVKQARGEQLTYNERSILINLQAELDAARYEMLAERYQKAIEILTTALRRDEYWWETHYLLAIALNRDPDEGGDRRKSVISCQQVKEYLKTEFPTTLDPCADELFSPRQMFDQYVSRANQFYGSRQLLLAENQLRFTLGIQPDENFPESENLNDNDKARIQFFYGRVASELRDPIFAKERYKAAMDRNPAYQDTVNNHILPYLDVLIANKPEIERLDVVVKPPKQPPVRSANQAQLSFVVPGQPDLKIEISEPQDPTRGKVAKKAGESHTVYGPITYKADMNIKKHKLKLIIGIAASAAALIGLASL